MSEKSREQKLVDLTFDIALTIQDHPDMLKWKREVLCTWVAKQLKECGFPTKGMGISWGVLVPEGMDT